MLKRKYGSSFREYLSNCAQDLPTSMVYFLIYDFEILIFESLFHCVHLCFRKIATLCNQLIVFLGVNDFVQIFSLFGVVLFFRKVHTVPQRISQDHFLRFIIGSCDKFPRDNVFQLKRLSFISLDCKIREV